MQKVIKIRSTVLLAFTLALKLAEYDIWPFCHDFLIYNNNK
jgi:hypothetical protein